MSDTPTDQSAELGDGLAERYSSIVEMAKAIHIGKSTIYRYRGRPGFPVEDDGTYDPRRVAAFIWEHDGRRTRPPGLDPTQGLAEPPQGKKARVVGALAEGTNGAATIAASNGASGTEIQAELDLQAEWRGVFIEEKARKMRFEREILEGKYVLLEEVIQGWANRALEMRNTLTPLASKIAARMGSVFGYGSEREALAILLEEFEGLCNAYGRRDQVVPGGLDVDWNKDGNDDESDGA